VLARPPGNKATVLVALAPTEGTPALISAGRDTKEPPPAKAFMLPASKPASSRNSVSIIDESSLQVRVRQRSSARSSEQLKHHAAQSSANFPHGSVRSNADDL